MHRPSRRGFSQVKATDGLSRATVAEGGSSEPPRASSAQARTSQAGGHPAEVPELGRNAACRGPRSQWFRSPGPGMGPTSPVVELKLRRATTH